MIKVGISGLGAVGSQLLQRLHVRNDIELIVIYDSDFSRIEKYSHGQSAKIKVADSPKIEREYIDLLFICTPAGQHLECAHRAVKQGVAVISISDRISDVLGLLELNEAAKENKVVVVPGVGFSPGLSCALALLAADEFDHVDEIHIAKDGTGGPACARQHHRALKRPSLDWRDGAWVRRPGGSGRELVWFPEPIGGADCYRAALPEAVLLQPVFPKSSRITARLSATRQDRFTSWLPMLIPPHNDGGIGAVRVELRGRILDQRATKIIGAAASPSTTSAIVAETLLRQVLSSNAYGTKSLASLIQVKEFITLVRQKGIKIFDFDGIPSTNMDS
ncbi:MAG: Gfo/Idh/MocA family oxidoreductase [Acidimicrobiales bacterium]|nr:Gfo/Idh/MocA family oxidoreductase [Acidimicrobiales bacterium]